MAMYPKTNDIGSLKFTQWLFNTCGMSGLSGFNYMSYDGIEKTKEEWAKWWKETILKNHPGVDQYTAKAENFTFAVTDYQLRHCANEKKKEKTSFLTWLVYREGCNVVHSYYNNAHPPGNTVAILVLHPHEAANGLKGKKWGLSVDEWLERHASGEVYENV